MKHKMKIKRQQVRKEISKHIRATCWWRVRKSMKKMMAHCPVSTFWSVSTNLCIGICFVNQWSSSCIKIFPCLAVCNVWMSASFSNRLLISCRYAAHVYFVLSERDPCGKKSFQIATYIMYHNQKHKRKAMDRIYGICCWRPKFPKEQV